VFEEVVRRRDELRLMLVRPPLIAPINPSPGRQLLIVLIGLSVFFPLDGGLGNDAAAKRGLALLSPLPDFP